MTEAIGRWWATLSTRERIMVGVAGTLALVIGGWLLVFRPLDSALQAERLEHAAALERRAAVAVRVAEIRRLVASGATRRADRNSAVAVSLALTQAAAERGFTLSRNDAQGDNAAAIAIANARATAVLPWIDELAGQGYAASDLTLRPNADGTVAVTATLRRTP